MARHDHLYSPIKPRIDVTRFRPTVEDRVWVKRLEWPSEERGLLVPDNAKPNEGTQLGIVVAVGPGTTYLTNYRSGKTKPYKGGIRVPCDVKVGDKVAYNRSEIDEFQHEGELYTALFEEQALLAVIE